MKEMENKKFGLITTISIGVGLIVATSCLLSLGLGVGLAGGGFVISMMVVMVLNIFLAVSFGELHALMPDMDGGLGQYTKVGLGPVISIISTISAYGIVNILAASVEIAMCGMVVNQVFLPMIPSPVISVALLVILTFVNYRGIDLFAKVQNVVVFLLIASLVLLGIISYFKLGTGTVIEASAQTAPVVTGFGGAVSLSALAFWLFIGIEFVIPMAKNVKNSKRNIPLAMIIGVVLLFFVQSMLGLGMKNYVSLDVLASSALPHMVFAEALLGQAGLVWMAIVSVLASVSTVNTILGSIPHVFSGMAKNDLLPTTYAKVNKKKVPIVGLFTLAVGNAVLIISGFTQTSGLITVLLAASCFWLTSYILVNITVLVLRKRYPDHPGRNKKLVLLGIPQVICIIGDIYMIWNIAEGEARIAIYKIFLVLLALLVAFAVIWVKFIKKQPMFKPASLDDVEAVELLTPTFVPESAAS